MIKKILPAALKKIEIDKDYQAIIKSDKIEKEKLKPILDDEIVEFVNAVSGSSELKDPNVARCGLRMINSLMIVRKLAGNDQIRVIEDVDNIKDE